MKLISVKSRYLRIVCAILFICISLSLVGCSAFNSTVTTKIDGMKWQVIAKIEELKLCDESGWSVPEGATVYKEQQEIKSYKTVGYVTKYRTEEYQEHVGYYLPTWRPRYETRTRTVSYQEPITEPVYATRYYYTIERWVFMKNVELGSGNDQNYDYPEYICSEKQRVKDIKYQYLVHLECDKSHVSHLVDKAVWENLSVGQEISGEKNQDGQVDVDWNRYR